MFTLEIDLPVPPSVNTMQRNRRKGRYDTPQYKLFKQEAALVIRQLPRIPHYEKPVKITYTFFFKTQRLCDIDNYIKPVTDVLTKMRVIEDDNHRHVKEYSVKFGGVDKHNPRVEVIVQEI